MGVRVLTGLGDGDDRPHRGFDSYHGLIADLTPAALLHCPVRAV
jgi:hypothetical protein